MYSQGNYYHIYNRGCNRLPIFFSDENYRFLIQIFTNNPVKAGLVDRAEEWEFSDFEDWIGIRDNELFCDNLLREYFDSCAEYKQFFKNYIQTLPSLEKHQDILFDEDE